MYRSALRRLTAAGASAVLLATGASATVGVSVAAAEEATCVATSTDVREPTIALGPLKHKYTYEKTVLKPSDARVPANGTVTYQTTISTAEGLPLIYSVVDHPPEGYTPVNAWVTAKHAIGEPRNKVQFSKQDGGYKVANGAGWMLTAGEPLIVEMEYRVPADAVPGKQVHSRGTDVSGTLKIGAQLPGLTSCVTVREKNAVEAGTGSLDDLGLGSVNTASTGAFGSLTDPTGSISDVINGLDFGKLIGS